MTFTTNKYEPIDSVRNEYLELNDKISKVSFALCTLKFEQEERELLEGQVNAMILYSQALEKRASIIAEKGKK